jgi:RNA polymerase sigma-70 factor (ECF subfamily)
VVRAAYREHRGELYRFSWRWTGDAQAAEDLVQEVVVRAWRSADRYDGERGSLRTWLFAIARNVAIDHRRAQAVRPAPAGGAGGTDRDERTVADRVDEVLATDEVVRGLTALTADQRVAIVETYLRDRPYDEVAADLGVSASTLRSRVFYGLKALRAEIQRARGAEGQVTT